jgi:hypothetical protein
MIKRSLKLPHRRRSFGIHGLDVTVLRDRDGSMPQDSLGDLVGNSKPVKIRRQPTAKSVPTMPLDSRFGALWPADRGTDTH